MTLTELRYITAVAREKNFSKAAAACFVSQPTLSVAIRKFEDELGTPLFERGLKEIKLTPIGEQVIEQAQRILEQVMALKQIALSAKDELAVPLRLGTIFTVGPYLLPKLIPALRKNAPSLSLQIEENFTEELSLKLKRGELDAIILSLPYDEPGIQSLPLYDETFYVALPKGHHWEKKKCIKPDELPTENLLLLGTKNCFRDQVLQTCTQTNFSQFTSGTMQNIGQGNSLETLRYMVLSGAGITVLPCTSLQDKDRLLSIRPFCRPVPTRRIALAWRKGFPRIRSIEAIYRAILASNLPCVQMLDSSHSLKLSD